MRIRNISVIFLLFLGPGHAAHAQGRDSSQPKPPRLAGSVVSSDKWIIRREKGEEEFQGNVFYRQGGYRFKSDWALYLKKTGQWKASGNVYGSTVWDNGARTECYGDLGEYFQDTGQGAIFSDKDSVRGRVEVIHYEPDRAPLHSYSVRATLNKPESLLTFLDDVLIRDDTTQAQSDNAVYDNLTSIFTLSGGYPVAYGAKEDYTFAIQGDLIKIYRKPVEKMTVSGRVQGWVRNDK